MDKATAIAVLEKQIKKIGKLDPEEYDAWEHQTRSYIVDFFGPNSWEFKFIEKFEFEIEEDYLDTDSEISAETFLNNCIETVKVKGLYKPPKGNFLKNRTNGQLVTIISIIAGIIYTAGHIVGKYTTDLNRIRLEQRIEELEDSLDRGRVRAPLRVTNNVPDNDTSRNQNIDSNNNH